MTPYSPAELLISLVKLTRFNKFSVSLLSGDLDESVYNGGATNLDVLLFTT